MRKVIRHKDGGLVLIINKFLGFMFEIRVGKLKNWYQARLQVYSKINKQSPKPALTNESMRDEGNYNHVITLCKPRFLLEIAHFIRSK